MNAPAQIPVEALRCQIRRVVEFALTHDRARLPIRAMLRDALDSVERDAGSLPIKNGRRA